MTFWSVFTMRRYAIVVYALALCLSVCLSVSAYVCACHGVVCIHEWESICGL